MKERTRNIAAGLLSIVAGAIWVPQLLPAGDEPGGDAGREIAAEADFESEDAGLAAGIDAGAGVAGAAGAGGSSEPATDPAGAGPAAGAGGGSGAGALPGSGAADGDARADDREDILSRAEDSLGMLESFLPSTRESLLDRLANSWTPPETVAQEGPERDDPPMLVLPPDGGVRARRPDPLQELLAANPLTGIIHGPGGALAMIGSRVVRVGDVFMDGAVEVTAIEPTRVIIVREGKRVVVDLPPFRARRSTAEEVDEPASDGEDPAANDSAPAPEANAAR